MIRYHICLYFIVLIFSFSAVNAGPTPEEETSLNAHAELRLIKHTQKYDHILELKWNPEERSTLYLLGLASRYQIAKDYTVGAYLNFTRGELTNDDWIRDDSIGKWVWKDVDGRSEQHVGIMAQKKWLLSSFSLKLRTSLERKVHAEENSLRIRPEVNWIISLDWVGYARYELYLSDEAPDVVYKHGIYLGGVYRAFSPFIVGPFFRYTRTNWWTSEEYENKFEDNYSIHDTSYALGVLLIYFI